MGLRIRQMIRRVHPRIPHLGYAPLGVVGLMLSKTSFHYLTHGHLSIIHSVCVPVVVSHSRSTLQQMDGGLIVRAWFADDDLEPEKC
jgi:hypothetical protein